MENVVDIGIYLINLVPSISVDGGISKEAGIGEKLNYSFMNTFGCESCVHIYRENTKKLDAKSRKCASIGFEVNDFGKYLWDCENLKIIR